MDLVMKKYQRRSHFLPSLFYYCLSMASLGLVLSSPLLLPSVCSSTKHLFTMFLPKMAAIILRPKYLFIVSNIIIIFLVRESKSSPPKPDVVYGEYAAEQSQAQYKQPIVYEEEVKEDIMVGESPHLDEVIVNEKDEVVKEDKEEMDDGMEEDEMSVECEELMGGQDEEEEDEGLSADELNRRVEDFIARTNSHRMVEARMIVLLGLKGRPQKNPLDVELIATLDIST